MKPAKKRFGWRMVCFLLAWGIIPISIAQIPPSDAYKPGSYFCIKAPATPIIDGVIDDKEWLTVPWTEDFKDITGVELPPPCIGTRVKMMWDDSCFYVAAEIPESNLWATYDKHDMVIFHENDFEVFLDPDKDTHDYLELEVNALGTIWDLLLTKPYRDGGKPLNSFDIKGLKYGVRCYGSLNKPGDTDEKWTIELAYPWQVIKEITGGKMGKPSAGDYWKVNFSRVQWDLEVKKDLYVKLKDDSGRDRKEHNCVWSPQGMVNMHMPEKWGLVIFCHQPNEKFRQDAVNEDLIRWKLRQVYYQQSEFYAKFGIYSTSPSAAGLRASDLDVKVNGETYSAKYCTGGKCWYLREDGRIWRSK